MSPLVIVTSLSFSITIIYSCLHHHLTLPDSNRLDSFHTQLHYITLELFRVAYIVTFHLHMMTLIHELDLKIPQMCLHIKMNFVG